jgi:hypothetical protein
LKRIGFFVLAAFIGAFLVACSAVLGFDPLTLRPTDADSGSNDGGPGSGDSMPADGTTSGGPEGSTCVDVNFQADPAHCGRCNHTCAGGTCDAGKCTAVRLADGLGFPEGLVVDETTVYVAERDENRILKFGKNALGACTVVPQPPDCVFVSDPASVFQPSGMAIDATQVFWANGSTISEAEVRSCPRAGCGGQVATPIAILEEAAFHHMRDPPVRLPLELVVRDGQIFWAENFTGAIRSRQVDGGGAITTYLENFDFRPTALVVDETQIYFTGISPSAGTSVIALPRVGSDIDGGSARVVVEAPAMPLSIALSPAQNLYFTVPFEGMVGDGRVLSAAKTADGGTAIGALATQMVDPSMIIVDATNAYWLVSGSSVTATGLVVYCPLSGCPGTGPIILAREQRWPRHLTQDADAIYWSNQGVSSTSEYDGQVWKLAKP